MNKEYKRKFVHISMVVFALAIGRFPPIAVCAACALAFVFNLLVLPKLTRRGLERDDDLKRGFSTGMLMYPAILLVIGLIFIQQQIFLAVAWGAMAFGDGFAGLVGQRLGGPRFSWNPDKRFSGLLGFVVFGFILTFGFIHLLPEETRLGLSSQKWAVILLVTMVAAGMVESLKGLVDDNFATPLTAAVTAWFLVGVNELPPLPDSWKVGLGLVLFLVVGSIGSRKIDVPGGLVGGLIAWLIFLGSGLSGLSLLFVFFVVGSFASHWKMKEKARLGLAQEQEGRRSVRHAISNGGVAALCGLTAWLYPEYQSVAQLMLAGSLASATADTLSSEMGNIYGKRFVNILTFKLDKRGLDGVISLEGTLFGAVGAVIVGLVFGLSQHLPVLIGQVALAGIFGNVVDSVLGASLQRKGYMTNDTVNFANTLAAALFILVLWG